MAIKEKYINIAGIAGIASVCALLLFLGACYDSGNKTPEANTPARPGSPTKGALIRSWEAVRVENKEIDDFYLKTQLFIDTFGRNNDAATNLKLYKTTNVDSLRKATQANFDEAKNDRQRALISTFLTFNPDNTVYLSFSGAMDTSKWILGADNVLILEDMNVGMNHEKITWEVLELTDTSLVVKMKEDTTYSKVTFHPDGK